MLKYKKLFKYFCTNTYKLIKLEFESNNLVKNDFSYIDKIYKDNINDHFDSPIPYVNDKMYIKLFYCSSAIPDNLGLQSWDILHQFIKYNINTLETDFLVDVIEQFSRINYYHFEFWYLIEKRMIKDIDNLSNKQIATIVYSLGYTMQGSNYIYLKFGEKVMNIGIKNFTKEEFIMLYNGFKNSRIKDKILNAMMERAKIELYPEILII